MMMLRWRLRIRCMLAGSLVFCKLSPFFLFVFGFGFGFEVGKEGKGGGGCGGEVV
jgi:hypothetical protein